MILNRRDKPGGSLEAHLSSGADITLMFHPWLLLAILGTTLAWVYWPVLVLLAGRWETDPHYSHGYLVLPFALLLLWRRRGELVPADRLSWWAVPLLVVGGVMRWAGAYGYYEWLEAASLLPSLAGLGVLLYGPNFLRVAWQPLLFLLFMIPLPYRLETALSGPLQRIGAECSAFALQLLGRVAVPDGNGIVTNDHMLEVVEACSGLGSLMVFLAMATGFALLVRRPLGDKVVIVLSAIPIALLANIARIVVTELLLETAGTSAAKVLAHDLAGWFMMFLAFGLLAAEVWALQFLFLTPVHPAEGGKP